MLVFLLQSSIDGSGDFRPAVYQWLSAEASAEEAAALLYGVLPAALQAREQWRKLERVVG